MIDVATRAVALAEPIPVDASGTAVLVASILITIGWLYYLFR